MLESGEHRQWLQQQQQQPVNATAKKKNNGKSRLRNLLAAIFNPNTNKSKQRVSTTTNKVRQQQSFHQISPPNTTTITNINDYSTPTAKSYSNLLSSNEHRLSLGRIGGSKQPTTPKSNSQAISTSSLKRVKSSQVAAQQTSYEAMRTVDLYLIRQIARNCMDFEMEQKIELEIRLRELACQSLLEARDEIDVLEVEKALLASDQRMNCYAAELEQQRRQLALSASSTLQRSGAGTKQRQQKRTPKSSNQSILSSPADSGRSSPLARDMLAAANNERTEEQAGLDVVSNRRRDSSAGTVKSSPSSAQSQDSHGCSAAGVGRASIGRKASRSKTNPMRQQALMARDDTNEKSALTQASNHEASPNEMQSKNCASMQSLSTNTNTSAHQRSRSLAGKKRAKLMLQQNIAKASNINCNMVTNNRATLSISELRIPLMWRDVDHFKGRGDYRRYAIFCLLKINSEIYDTQLITDVDRQVTDVNFDDTIMFHDIEHDFELILEVYSCVYLEEFSFSSTPRKLKEKFSNSMGRAMGRRLANQTASDNYTRELDAYQEKNYRFTMIASASFKLEDAHDCVKTYDLVLVSPEAHYRRPSSSHLLHSTTNNSNSVTLSRPKYQSQYGPAWLPWSTANNSQAWPSANNGSNLIVGANLSPSNLKESHKNTLPLFGHFCCKLTVKPDVFDKCVKTGYLRVASIQIPLSEQPKVGGSPTGSTGNDAASISPDSAASTENNNHQLLTNSPQSTMMLRSALAASSKLATLSLETASIHWAVLRNFALHLWPVDERRLENALRRGHPPQVDISRRPPFTISIDKFTRLLRVSNSSLTIEADQGCFVFAVFDPYASIADDYRFIDQRCPPQQPPPRDEIAAWLRPIEQFIYDSHIWASVLNHFPAQKRPSLPAVVAQQQQHQGRQGRQQLNMNAQL